MFAEVRPDDNRAEEETNMSTVRLSRFSLAAAALLAGAGLALAQSPPAPAGGPSSGNATLRDGQRDFDPLIGNWKATLKRLVHPLTGSHEWVEFEGTQITRSVWGGRASMDEFHVHSPGTNTDVDGLTIRLYNPQSHQWSIYWSNAKKGTFDWPPTVGRWQDGRGEFYDQETFEGKSIIVRYVWSDVTGSSAHFEQSFSEDGGKTWEPNWISTITRMKE